MEIEKPPVGGNRFWQKFYKSKLLTLTVVSALWWAGVGVVVTFVAELHNPTGWVLAIAGFVATFTILILSFNLVGRPLKDLLSAVNHISGERSAAPPPNPNQKGYEKTGFKQILQTIYELSSGSSNNQGQEKEQVTVKDSSLSLLSQALDNTSTGFAVLDRAKKVTYANKAAPVSIDTSGQKQIKLLFGDNDNILTWLKLCEDHEVRAEKIWTRVPDRLPNEEDRRFFDVIASYNKGAEFETVLTFIDRTSTYQSDEESLDFISFAAHELRGPITVIRGYLDVLEDELASVLQPDHHELFKRLTVSANRLSGYINNILNTSRYDRRHLKVHLAEEKLKDIYDTIQDDMSLRASSQNRLLNVSIPESLPTIAADRASLSEVLGNLIDNAIKYSLDGGIINVTASVKGDFVEIGVEDHGIGMPGSVVSNLFKKFYRSHRSREAVSGTGIGLYISKAIVESHGGTISVRSEEGKGSVFTASVPIYATVADKLQASHNSNEGLIDQGKGWIKNHSMFRG